MDSGHWRSQEFIRGVVKVLQKHTARGSGGRSPPDVGKFMKIWKKFLLGNSCFLQQNPCKN